MEQICLIFILLIFLGVGHWLKSHQLSFSEFIFQSKKLNWFVIATGMSMTFAGGASILNLSSVGYTYGWWTLVDPIGVCLGLIISSFLFDFYYNNDALTIASLLSCHDKKLTLLLGAVSFSVYILVLSAQFVALSKLISPYFPFIPPRFITFILSTLIFSYVHKGGFQSVSKTDVLQFVIVLLFFIIPVFFIFTSSSFFSHAHFHVPTFEKMSVNMKILLGIFVFIAPLSQDVYSRIKSAISPQQGILGLCMGGLFYSLIVVTTISIGVFFAHQSHLQITDTETAFTLFFKNYLPNWGLIGIIAAFSAIVSTLDSFALNSIVALSHDVYPILMNSTANKKTIFLSSLFVYLTSLSIALFFNQILGLVLTSFLVYISSFLPVTFARLIGLKNNDIFLSLTFLLCVVTLIEIFRLPVALKALVYPLIGFFQATFFYILRFIFRSTSH